MGCFNNSYRNWDAHVSNGNPEKANTKAIAQDLDMIDGLREAAAVRMASY